MFSRRALMQLVGLAAASPAVAALPADLHHKPLARLGADYFPNVIVINSDVCGIVDLGPPILSRYVMVSNATNVSHMVKTGEFFGYLIGPRRTAGFMCYDDKMWSVFSLADHDGLGS